jgi:hypothetical protein
MQMDNAKLRSELEQVHQVLAESHTARSLLSTSQDEFERECVGLSACVGALKQEKAKIISDCTADLATERKKFRDYCL